MKNLFFGDSITSGENNKNISYVNYIKDSFRVGVSGTTIGEYSIYPVDGNSLLSQIPRYDDEIREAKNIFIEYGLNDVASIMSGNVKAQQVTIAFYKAIDAIKQINPDADIYFLSAYNALDTISKAQENYLHKYFEGLDFEFDSRMYCGMYEGFLSIIASKTGIKVIEMFKDDEEYRKHMDTSDNLHPNDDGYKIIASNIKEGLDVCPDA